MKTSAITFLLILTFLSKNYAQESDSLLDLSLEDLMAYSITSASKVEENLFDAPSIVQTITAKEIQDFGGDNLYEILERATAFYGISSFVFPQNIIGLRGDYSTHISPNVLFLIDGRPFRESIKGGQNVGILTAFPIMSIKQIEIIRGPGSVLYGSNAYTGVVNIITKKATEPTLSISGGGGSLGTTEARAYGGTSIGDLKINAGLNFFKTDGFDFADSTRFRGEARQFGATNFGQEVISSYLNLNYKSFTLSGFYGRNNMGHITSVTSEEGIYEGERIFLDAGYAEELIPDKYNLSVNLTYNRIHDVFTTIEDQLLLSNDLILEITNFIDLTSKLQVTIGGSAARLEGEQGNGDGFSVEPYDKYWYNAYAVANFSATDWLKLVGGMQLNKVPNVDANVVPRLAAIAKSSQGFGGKLLFGQAFRAPYPGETDINLPIVAGEPDLIPTTVSTFEVQGFYESSKGNISMTYFRSLQEDLIDRTTNTNPDISSTLIYANLGELVYEGYEIEGKYSPRDGLYVVGSYAYQINKDEDDNENLTLLPNHMFKMGVSYTLDQIGTIGVFNSSYSEPHRPEGSADGLGSMSSFNWLTAKIDVAIDDIFKLENPSIGLTLEGLNLLDQEVYNPEFVFGHYNATLARPGRMFQVGLRVDF